MRIASWLDTLPAGRDAAVADDIDCFRAKARPFLSDELAEHHVARLSSHLGRLAAPLRRAVIGYTLYTRQIDRIQAAATKDFCRDGCDRPPVGCCNARHCDVFTPSDYLLYRPTGLSLELAGALARLQRAEDDSARQAGARHVQRYCPYLTETGCTLQLAKSPRCVHYLCQTLQTDLGQRYGAAGAAFAEAMAETAGRAVACCEDFTNPAVLAAAREMLSAEAARP
ncbi:MAG: hypothetical protein B193_1565 [Solidesulfovibrio magneticus str. Maddingley MBC34]|uniref:Uncharacterized protein n=1 Tax=Solidesulfovibrio magneticus str. Maddingley MBC34 TaxID=1206767 RepID=K6GRY0_9BACT|nr:MAG: hypothetical protein B193_1565 [Solidesulfovibrio magneticus str. Maddingley MBC34]